MQTSKAATPSTGTTLHPLSRQKSPRVHPSTVSGHTTRLQAPDASTHTTTTASSPLTANDPTLSLSTAETRQPPTDPTTRLAQNPTTAPSCTSIENNSRRRCCNDHLNSKHLCATRWIGRFQCSDESNSSSASGLRVLLGALRPLRWVRWCQRWSSRCCRERLRRSGTRRRATRTSTGAPPRPDHRAGGYGPR